MQIYNKIFENKYALILIFVIMNKIFFACSKRIVSPPVNELTIFYSFVLCFIAYLITAFANVSFVFTI